MILDTVIEQASISDADEILELQKAAFLGQARIYNNVHLPPLVQTFESLVHDFTGMTFLKAVLNSQIIGSVRFLKTGNCVNVCRLIVHPDFQNKGAGTFLMKSLENLFPVGTEFHLFTGDKSSRNIHLYTKLGYHVTRKEATDLGIVHIHMAKKLK